MLRMKAILLAGLAAATLTACISIEETRGTQAATAAQGGWILYPPFNEHTATRGADAQRLARIDEAMRAYVDEGRLAGATLIVMRDGRELVSGAWGWRDREASDAMREDTIFRIASQTKALTSAAIMMLMEEGRLLLEDPVGKHLPEWASTTVAVARGGGGYDTVPARRPITIRDLLTHTAGVSYGTGPAREAWEQAGIFGWYFADRNETTADVVARMAALPMAAQPGEQFVYGYNTDILGVVVEKISGQSLGQFFADRLTGPLGMTDTYFCLPAEKRGRLAVVYSAQDGRAVRAPDPGAMQGGSHVGQGQYAEGSGPCRAEAGGAGLVSTTRDYARFLEMLRRGGELGGRRYLSRKSVELMTVDHLVEADYPAGTGFGLGFRVVTDLGKSGRMGSQGEYSWGGAYHSAYWVDPQEGLVVVFLTQLIPAGGIDVQGKLRNLILQAVD